MSAVKVMFIGLAFVIGWVVGYLFIRQIAFNFNTAIPVIDSMKKCKEDLIVSDNAKKYTSVSTGTCIFMILLISAIVVVLYIYWNWFDLPLTISYFAGLLVSLFMMIGKQKPDDKGTFETFCKAYYRFIPDDELRTDAYNCKIPAMKLRCHDMGVSTDWIPAFKKED